METETSLPGNTNATERGWVPWVAVGTAFVIVVGSLFCLVGALYLVLQPSARDYPCIGEIPIDGTAFPGVWEADDVDTDFPPLAPWTFGRAEVEYADRSYYPISKQGGWAMMRIRRYKGARVAHRKYRGKVDVAFRARELYTPWIDPVGMEFESSATKYRLACAHVNETEKCAYVAQYDVYVVEFYFHLNDARIMTYDDLGSVLRAVDDRMFQALEWD